ncbi:ExbD/TolR family protein [Roseateles sp. BYS87W]|uniref:ExbD/TolR family protein n=1 Tax=Pelomonas baiyunensis TaxID=3299026 RepID=A0ABW7H502_9BURK
MSADTSEYWGSESLSPPLRGAVASLAAVILSLVALWVTAIPNPTHSIAVDVGGCHRSIEHRAQKTAVHTVSVDFDDVTWWDGELVHGRAGLDARMLAIGSEPWDGQAEVRIRPSQVASYGAVLAVMASAQRHNVRKFGVIAQASFTSDGSCPIEIPELVMYDPVYRAPSTR